MVLRGTVAAARTVSVGQDFQKDRGRQGGSYAVYDGAPGSCDGRVQARRGVRLMLLHAQDGTHDAHDDRANKCRDEVGCTIPEPSRFSESELASWSIDRSP